MKLAGFLLAVGLSAASLSMYAQFNAPINNGPLLEFWKQNNMSPVPSAYQNQMVPGAIVRRVGVNTDVLGTPAIAKSLDVATDQRYQPAVNLDTSKDFTLIGAILGYSAQAKIGTTKTVEIGEANITCKSIAYLDAQKLVYNDAEVKSTFQSNGGKNAFVYVVQQVCYTTSLTVTEKSSRDILGGVNATPKDCSAKGADTATNSKVSDLQSDPSKKATSSYGAAGSWCVNSNKKIVINSETPYAVASKLVWIALPGKYSIPDAATDPNRLRATSWVDLRIR